VDVNGQVTGTNIVDGYTTPADSDTSGTADYLEAGAAPSITTQPINVTVFAGSGTTFSVSATDTDTYQWQISANGGTTFTNLTDGTTYSGSSAPILNISKAELTMNNYQYRAIVSNSAYLCASPVISDAATLRVLIRTVISNRRITYRVKKN